MWDNFPVIFFRVIVVPQLIIAHFIISVCYIFADVNIVIFIFTAIRFKLVILCIFKFILEVKFVIMAFLHLFQGRVIFNFLFYAFIQDGSRHLQQFHKLNLLRRQFL